MKRAIYIKIALILLSCFVLSMLFSAVVPIEIFLKLKGGLHINAYKLYVISILLTVTLAFLLWRMGESHIRYLEVIPFFLLFLYGSYRISKFPVYNWGADDAFYYSYLNSAFVDHDLDLTNQYEKLGISKLMGSNFMGRRTPRGYVQNVFPVGSAIFWAPFYLIGSGIAHFLNSLGFQVPLDGYSRPYVFTIVIGNVLYVCSGLYFCYLFATRYFSRFISFASTFGFLIGYLQLYFFFKQFALVSEPLAMAAIGGILLFVQRREKNFSLVAWFLMGILSGFTVLVRFHNAVFLLIPAYILVRSRAWNALAVYTAGGLLGVLPQLFAWYVINGSWYVNYAGQLLNWWRNPFFLEVLFSSRKGLFPWQPLLVFAIPGIVLFLKKDKLWAILFLTVLLLTVYINASQRDWWGSVAFGSRRFLPCLILFITGLACFYSWIVSRWKWFGHAFCLVVLLFFAQMTFSIKQTYSNKGMELYHSVVFSDIFDSGFSRVYNYVVYPLEFPAQLFYHLKYGMEMYCPLSEYFIGDDILYMQQQSTNPVGDPRNPIFGQGWKFDNGTRICESGMCTLNIPMFLKDRPDIFMEFSGNITNSEKNVWIDFFLNGEQSKSKKFESEPEKISYRLNPKNYKSAINLVSMRIYRRHGQEETPILVLRNLQFTDKNPD